MASSSLSNFLSLFTPSKPPTPPPKAPPPNISLSTHSPSSSSSSSSPSSSRNRDGLVPLVMSNEAHQYHYNPVSSSSADLMAVVCPSLAYANTLFFRSAYNVQVIVDDNEPEEKLLNRFRREVMRAGVIQECKRRRFFENKQEEKKRKTREAAKRNKRRRTPFRPQIQDKQEGSKKREEVDDDNWELPEGNLPS